MELFPSSRDYLSNPFHGLSFVVAVAHLTVFGHLQFMVLALHWGPSSSAKSGRKPGFKRLSPPSSGDICMGISYAGYYC